MKFLRIILFPFVPIYFLVTWIRNLLYDKGIKSSKSYDIPIICVGNLSTGGTGKTPMIEYLIRLLNSEKHIATLSRGYKRTSQGFVLADSGTTVNAIGDEPYQFFNKFESIKVAVDANRRNGIERLMALPDSPEVILLDDAFQHRKVEAGFNILLTAYNNLYYNDIVLPTGNLREPKSGSKRADIIVITKCPKDITEVKKREIINGLKLQPQQSAFFSYIEYAELVISNKNEIKINELPHFTLVTGIANAKPLVDFLKREGLEFDHLEFDDHYSFKTEDIKTFENLGVVVTTEKDYMRLAHEERLKKKLYYLPIRLKIEASDSFDKMVKAFIN
ncbi:MAG: tetraacyldisaccharide 4'-kinase [Winogradskyella sp.]|uniref:tetraacyldisaccharide 4'-kinase n=1 Tax=Winogradskyella sp. TaxID=1883156 RepID=UPI001796099E|nr:tetraacyldisaccharide 4'-kinase [Winogradskyella sp.]